MVAQFDEDVVQGRSIIVDEEEDGTINPVFAKDEITGTFTECGCYAKNTHTAKVWERADNREDNRFIGSLRPSRLKESPQFSAPHRLRESPARSVVFAPETGNPWYSLKSTARAKERHVK